MFTYTPKNSLLSKLARCHHLRGGSGQGGAELNYGIKQTIIRRESTNFVWLMARRHENSDKNCEAPCTGRAAQGSTQSKAWVTQAERGVKVHY